MIIYLLALTGIILSYITGSFNFAILISRIANREDIRELGNNNPGSSNVIRNIGLGWGILTGLLDGFKGLVPIIIFHLFFFKEYTNFNFAVLYIMGIAAVIGHCKSIFLKFRGGGGIATMTAVSLFFIPAEFLMAMILAGIITFTFFPKAEKRFGQKIPLFFVLLAPFLCLATTLLLDIPLFIHYRIGNHLPSVVICSFIMSLSLLWINSKFLRTKIRRT